MFRGCMAHFSIPECSEGVWHNDTDFRLLALKTEYISVVQSYQICGTITIVQALNTDEL